MSEMPLMFMEDNDIDAADEALELSIIAEDEASDAEVVVPALEGSFVEIEDTQTQDHECSICAKSFSSKYNLQRHIRIHSSNSVHCKKCLSAFESDNALQEHISVKHPKSHFICEDCGSDFSTKTRLEKHRILKHHEENKKKKVCAYIGCGRVFVESSKLEDHINTHLNIKPYSCDKPGCDKRYASRFTRNRHRKQCGPERKEPLKSCSEWEIIFQPTKYLYPQTGST